MDSVGDIGRVDDPDSDGTSVGEVGVGDMGTSSSVDGDGDSGLRWAGRTEDEDSILESTYMAVSMDTLYCEAMNVDRSWGSGGRYCI